METEQPTWVNCLVRALLSRVRWDTSREKKNYTLTSTAPASKYLTIAKEQPCDCYFNPHTLLWQMMFFKLNLKIDLLLLWTPAALFKVGVVSVVFHDNPISDGDIKKRTPFVWHAHKHGFLLSVVSTYCVNTWGHPHAGELSGQRLGLDCHNNYATQTLTTPLL